MGEITLERVDPSDPDFVEMWEDGWNGLIVGGNLDYSAPPPFGISAFDLAWVIYVDGVPAGIRAYHDWDNGTAQGRLTYVKPEYRRQGICDITWEQLVAEMKTLGIKRIVYTVLADAVEMKAACDKRGDKIRSYQYEAIIDG